jgi:peptidoglycan hydrolase-like protein with peptidoglycan-binding domain
MKVYHLFTLVLVILLFGLTTIGAQFSDPTNSAEIRMTQSFLMWLGYYGGPVNGVITPGLEAAITAFQQKNNMPVTGAVSDAMIQKLRDNILALQQEPQVNLEPKADITPTEVKQLRSSNPVDRAYAAYMLGEIGPRASGAIPYLLKLLDDHNRLEWQTDRGPFGPWEGTSPSREAAIALSKMGTKGIHALKAAFYVYSIETDSNQGLNFEIHSIIEGLSRISGNDAVDIMVDALFVKSTDAADEKAGEYLARAKDPRTLEPLCRVVVDKNNTHRAHYAAALVLGELRDPRAIESLIAAMYLEDLKSVIMWDKNGNRIQATWDALPLVWKSADALKKITGLDFGPDPEAWRRWRERNPNWKP